LRDRRLTGLRPSPDEACSPRGALARATSAQTRGRTVDGCQLTEGQATLSAIRKGEVDSVAVQSTLGRQVYTLDGVEFDYRVRIASMDEVALVLTRSTVIL